MESLELPILLGALFGVVVLRTLGRVARHRLELFDDELTTRDRHVLTSLVFYVLVPLVVGASLLVSAGWLALWDLSASEIRYGVYWGRALIDPAEATAAQRAVLAATPELFTLGCSLLLVVWTVRQPINGATNFVRLSLARMLAGIALFAPVLSLFVRDGFARELYQALEAMAPHTGQLAVALHLLGAAVAVWLWRSRRVRTRYLLLASPLYDEAALARATLESDEHDADARTDLAHSLFAAGDRAPALAMLDRVLEGDPGHARAGYLAGVAALEEGDALRAAGHLRAAGERLESEGDPTAGALRFEVILALGAARLALGDGEGALLTVEEATADAPREPRALFLHAEALAATGRVQAARARLQRALAHADGGLARAIRARLSRFP